MKKNTKKILSNNKGFTGIDLVVSLILLVMFVGLITSLMSSTYKLSLEILKSANANAYATIIFEKVDEKAYEEVTNNFVENLKSAGEISIDNSEYTIEFSVQPITSLEEDVLKKVDINIKYDINGEEKSIVMTKLKIKEVYKSNL